MEIRKFAIFYNNGDVVYGGGEDDELVPVYFSRKWLEAPSDGVSHINIQNDDVCRATLKEQEYYFYLPHNFHGKGYIGGSLKIGPYLRQAVEIGSLVKFGGWTDTKNYRAIAVKAHRDTYIRSACGDLAENEEDAAD